MSMENPGFVRIRIFLIYIQFVTSSDEEKKCYVQFTQC